MFHNAYSVWRPTCKEINSNVYFTSAAEDARTFAGIVFKQSNISLSLWLDVGTFTNTNSSDIISVGHLTYISFLWSQSMKKQQWLD